MSTTPKSEEHALKNQLDRVELKLKALDVLTKRIGIVAALLGLMVTGLNIGLWVFQLKLTRGQAEEQAEKNRVSLGMELRPAFDPSSPRRFWVYAKFTNRSYKEVNIAMVGIRIWKEWSRETNVHDTPERLLHSDIRINDCSRVRCPVVTSKSKLDKLDLNIVVTPNEQDFTEAFGPYEFSQHDAPDGFWLDGLAYTKEQDEGRTCAIAGPGTAEGAFPVFCRSEYLGSLGCASKGTCLAAYATPHSFKF